MDSPIFVASFILILLRFPRSTREERNPKADIPSPTKKRMGINSMRRRAHPDSKDVQVTRIPPRKGPRICPRFTPLVPIVIPRARLWTLVTFEITAGPPI